MSKPIPLIPNQIYHIYNRGNNRENIFLEPRNYPYFLQLITEYILPITHIYAYCLLPNHFHLLLRVKERAAQELGSSTLAAARNLVPKKEQGSDAAYISQQFATCFGTYSKAINKSYQRSGSLFESPFKRKQIDNAHYLTYLVTYIQQNPQKHGLIKDFRHWKYSSYQALLSTQATKIGRAEVLDWFGGRTALQEAHDLVVDEKMIGFIIDGDD